jgi:hypothetical protein
VLLITHSVSSFSKSKSPIARGTKVFNGLLPKARFSLYAYACQLNSMRPVFMDPFGQQPVKT